MTDAAPHGEAIDAILTRINVIAGKRELLRAQMDAWRASIRRSESDHAALLAREKRLVDAISVLTGLTGTSAS